MSEVSLRIGGKDYAVSCAEGEEPHIARLGAMIDAKFAQMQEKLAPRDSHNFLFAALLLADELYEVSQSNKRGGGEKKAAEEQDKLRRDLESSRKTVEELELELDALRADRDKIARELSEIADASSDQSSAEAMLHLEELAQRAEKCADALEQSLPAT